MNILRLHEENEMGLGQKGASPAQRYLPGKGRLSGEQPTHSGGSTIDLSTHSADGSSRSTASRHHLVRLDDDRRFLDQSRLQRMDRQYLRVVRRALLAVVGGVVEACGA